MASFVFQPAAAVAWGVPPGQCGLRCRQRRDRALNELVRSAFGLGVVLPRELNLVTEAQRSAGCDDDAIPAVHATTALARAHVLVDPRQTVGVGDAVAVDGNARSAKAEHEV